MAREDLARERTETSVEAARSESTNSDVCDSSEGLSLLDRRSYLKLAGAAVATMGGIRTGTSYGSASAGGGPPASSDWEIAFEDDFEGGSLDESTWNYGFGWGPQDPASGERIRQENVRVENDDLRFVGTHDGDQAYSGGIHTYGTAEFGPGTYWEAKIKPPARVGFLPTFWALSTKNVPEGNRGEIDFFELFQKDGGHDDTHVSHHYIHYGTEGDTNQRSMHYDAETDLTQDYHIYGCAFHEDRLEMYVDGTKVGTHDDVDAMESIRNAAPFYLMLTLYIEKVATPDYSEQWGESMDIDWVRVWDRDVSADPSLTIDTGAVTDVTDSDATLGGEVTDLDGASSIDAAFEIRKIGSDSWMSTESQTLTAAEAFSATVTGLNDDTNYEFRAVGNASDGDTATGVTRTFATEAGGSTETDGETGMPPTIECAHFSERGSPNPHAEISGSWRVSDPNGDLEEVNVDIRDSSGRTVRFEDYDIDGETASGSSRFRIKHGGGTTYDCLLTVVDAESRTDSRSVSVDS